MAENAFVARLATPSPWAIEEMAIRELDLPLNLDQNLRRNLSTPTVGRSSPDPPESAKTNPFALRRPRDGSTLRLTLGCLLGDLFIVDNSEADWKVRQYLHEWADIARSFDIATAYLEIGALLALDGECGVLTQTLT